MEIESKDISAISFYQYWLILRRRWLPATSIFVAVFGVCAIATFLKKPVYQSTGELIFNKSNNYSSLTDISTPTTSSLLSFMDINSNPLKTQAKVILSVPVLQKTIQALGLKDQKGNRLTPQELKQQLSVVQVNETDILQVSYESTDPQEAAIVANKIMDVYVEQELQTNRAEVIAARKFLERQLPSAKEESLSANEALRKFEVGNNILNLEEEAKTAVGLLGDLDSQINQLQSQLAGVTSKSVALQQQMGMSLPAAIAETSLSQSRILQKNLDEYEAVRSQLKVAQSQYQDEHPIVASLISKEAALKELVNGQVGQVLQGRTQAPNGKLANSDLEQQLTEDFANLELERSGLSKQLSALTNQKAEYQKRSNVLPTLRQGARVLQQNLDAAQANYQALLQKYNEVRLKENQNVGNVRINEAAFLPVDPIAPNVPRNLTLGLLLGTLLGIGTALILEARDNSIKTVKEVKDVFGHTLLGTIPALMGEVGIERTKDLERPTPSLPVRDLPRSSISEAYRMLQANLKFLSSDKVLKVITITSAVPKEGKSTVSANMAIAMAQMGHKVLLIDADMRRPSQHQIWELPNTVGLSNILVDQAQFRTAVREAMENLDVLTAGVLPPNPLALLDSNHMSDLIKNLAESYDFVVIDTPPLAISADALVLGKMTDGVLFVARPGVANISGVQGAKESLAQSGQNVLGLVVNSVIPENEPDSYYYYYAKGYYAEENPKAQDKSLISHQRS